MKTPEEIWNLLTKSQRRVAIFIYADSTDNMTMLPHWIDHKQLSELPDMFGDHLARMENEGHGLKSLQTAVDAWLK